MVFNTYAKLSRSIVPLISLALGGLFLLLIFVLFSHDRQLSRLERAIENEELLSLKVQLVGQMMEYARTRSLLATEIIDTDDIFKQDELNIQLELYAGRYAGLRDELLQLPLTEEEQAILDSQFEIVSVIVPALRKAAELAMSGNSDDRKKASDLLYQLVIPGQSELIASMSRLVEMSEQQTAVLTAASRDSVLSMKQRSAMLIGPVLFLISLLSIFVVIRVKHIKSDLVSSRDNLERSVTERTRELRKAQDMLQSILDTIPVSVYWMDSNATYMGGNARFVRDAGFSSPQDIVGKTDHDMPWQQNANEFRAEDLAVMLTGEPRIDKVESHKDRDGNVFWLESSKVPLQDEDNNAVGMLGMYHDVTERMQAQEKLKIATEQAEAANTAKSLFLANMSHEIRTPMNTIIGMSYLVLQTRLNDMQRNYVSKVHRSAESLLGIINDILDFSKIEANKIELENTNFWLEDVFDNLANLVGLRAEEKGLELLFDISPNIHVALIGDPLRLGQVLVNLVSNAIKFTERGEIVVSVRDISSDSDTIRLEFSVRDDGIGMSEEQVSALFRPFNQADASTTREFGGTGLGLSIARRLTEIMHGNISVESEPGKGSTFTFDVLLKKQYGAIPREELIEGMESMRVLIVDDSVSACEILKSILVQYGVQVDMVHDGISAIDAVESAAAHNAKPYDLILVDWQMPGMDGLEVKRKLEQIEGCNAPPVVMHTAYGREEILREASDAEARDMPLLVKPVTQSALLDIVASVMGQSLYKQDRFSDHHHKQDYVDSIRRLKGSHVLLVEDNALNQELALALLTGNGISVELAVNGQEAVDLLKHKQYDGVLMDCMMPVLDGYDATRIIRKTLDMKQLPIIAMTANAMLSDIDKVLDAGMNDHIAKPVNVQDMFNTMARWIKPSRPGMRVIEADAEDDEQLQASIADHAAAGSPDTGCDAVLNAVPGLDMDRALARVAGNRKFYLKLLYMFLERQPGKNIAMQEAVIEERWQDVRDAAHEAKGVLGSIGAVELHESAANLERMITNQANDDLVREKTSVFLHDVAEFSAILDRVLP